MTIRYMIYGDFISDSILITGVFRIWFTFSICSLNSACFDVQCKLVTIPLQE